MRAGFWVGAALSLALVAGCSGSSPEVLAPSPAAPAPVSVEPVPDRVDIPAIKASGPLIPLGVDAGGGTEEPPIDKPGLGSWYEPGPRPGAVGPAVVLGHINGRGVPGIFSRLSQVKVGDLISIHRVDGSSVQFEAYKVDTIDKNNFPTQAVYGNTTDPEIRVITCGGALDRVKHRYLSNVIVYGKIVGD